MTSQNGNPPPPATLGGQAVVEGVMIRGAKGFAVCVRRPDGEIVCRSERTGAAAPAHGVPVLRGMFALGDTLTQGMRALVWSAQVAAGREPEEPSERQVRFSAAMSLGALAGFFLLAPAATGRRTEGLARRLKLPPRLAGVTEGFTRVGMLVGYLRTIGRLPQAQRLFAYHGAEHRAIQAYEARLPLDVDTLRRFPNAHVRCGTSFLLTTTVISSILYGLLGPMNAGRRVLTRVALMPLVVGLSYETIRLASISPNPLLKLLLRPNLQLQALTTRDPDEEQMAVAIAAVRAAVELHQSA
jgi:uncharacterized protein YqhQ